MQQIKITYDPTSYRKNRACQIGAKIDLVEPGQPPTRLAYVRGSNFIGDDQATTKAMAQHSCEEAVVDWLEKLQATVQQNLDALTAEPVVIQE